MPDIEPMASPGAAGAPVAIPTRVLLRDATSRGLTRANLRTAGWERLSQGLYAPRQADRTTNDLARSVSEVLPRESAYGHLTSAHLRHWWLPNRLGRHVLFATTTSGVHVQRRGLYVRRSRFEDYEDVDGVRVVSAAQTLVELARDLTLLDLVPLVDCALREGADPEAVLRAARPRMPGARRLRRAVTLADPRSESWWESVLRLLHVLPGLGPVDSQVELWADDILLARADLHLVGTTRFPECDGGRHRDRARHDHDLYRDRAMSRRGYERYGYTTAEIAGNPGRIIRDAEEARGWPHDPARLRTWWGWARPSTLTPYGRTRLAARLERYRLATERRVVRSGGGRGASYTQDAPHDAA